MRTSAACSSPSSCRVYEFLAKPFTPEQVMEILKTYCRVTVPSNALVVDDSATVRRIIKKVFANSIFNIDVTEAGDGQTALDHCENGEFDVVFLDCNMPGLPGTATLEQLLERDPGVKVIMISGERNETRRRWALDRGAAAFLYKPFNATDVDRELHALFGLRMPQLAGIEPMKFARTMPTPPRRSRCSGRRLRPRPGATRMRSPAAQAVDRHA